MMPVIVENGLKIFFLNITENLKIPRIPHSGSKKKNISIENKSILRKEVIAEGSRKSANFISAVFTRKKKKWCLKIYSEFEASKQLCCLQIFRNGIHFGCLQNSK